MATPYQYLMQPGQPTSVTGGILSGIRQGMATNMYADDMERAKQAEQSRWQQEFDALNRYRDTQSQIGLLGALNRGSSSRSGSSGSSGSTKVPSIVNLSVGKDTREQTIPKFVAPHVDRLAGRTRKNFYPDTQLPGSEIDHEVSRTRDSLWEEFRRMGKGENEIRVLMDTAFDQYWDSRRGAPSGVIPGVAWGKWGVDKTLSPNVNQEEQRQRLRRIFLGYPESNQADQDKIRQDVMAAMGVQDARSSFTFWDKLKQMEPLVDPLKRLGGAAIGEVRDRHASGDLEFSPGGVLDVLKGTFDRRMSEERDEYLNRNQAVDTDASILNPDNINQDAVTSQNTLPPPNDGPQPPILSDQEFQILIQLSPEQLNATLVRLPMEIQSEFYRRKLASELMGQLFHSQ